MRSSRATKDWWEAELFVNGENESCCIFFLVLSPVVVCSDAFLSVPLSAFRDGAGENKSWVLTTQRLKMQRLAKEPLLLTWLSVMRNWGHSERTEVMPKCLCGAGEALSSGNIKRRRRIMLPQEPWLRQPVSSRPDCFTLMRNQGVSHVWKLQGCCLLWIWSGQ